MAYRLLRGLSILIALLILSPYPAGAVEDPAPSTDAAGVEAETEAEPGEDIHENMAKVHQGRFRMGLTFDQVGMLMKWCERVDRNCVRWWYNDAFPAHNVRLDAFWIDIYEVTNEKYLEFVKATGHRPALDDTCESKACWAGNLWKGNSFLPEVANQPVTQVSWDDADAYCKWRGKRLPTEAEWEKAARGPMGNIFPWGIDPPPGRATYKRKWRGKFTMTNVGSYVTGVSVYGVHDMAGNVWEWVSDWYDQNAYENHPKRNPKGPATGEFKVVRGGSWVNFQDSLVSAFRRWSRPEVRFNDTGFRCAMDAGE